MRTLWAVVTGLAIVLAGCAAKPPIVDYDTSIDFASYKTYAYISDKPLMRAPDSPPGSPLLEGRLIKVTDDSMAVRGYTRVDDPEQADFAIGFTVGSRDKIRVNSYPEPYRPYYGAWGWGGPYYAGSTNVDVQQYTEGTLAIDIYDVAGHKPAWHGTATKRVTEKMQRNPDETITQVVNEILAGFPPGNAAP